MKVMALDGNSLAYRAFFALPDTMTTVDGEVTNAVFGFCSMFATLLKDHEPDGIVVVFDRKEKTFRHEQAPEYKAQREKQPDTLYAQMDVIKQVLAAAGVLVVDCAGYEGDDIIATIANRLASEDRLLIVTGDRDSYQLVRDPQVRVIYNKRGVSDYALYDEAGIKERTGVTPAQYPDYAALRGDPSDNLDGVPGVGEKTAAKLITAYGDLTNVFDHADEQTPKLKEALHASRERVMRNAVLMRLVRDVPVEVPREALTPRPDLAALGRQFTRLEFSTMLNRWKPLLSRFAAPAASTTTAAEEAEVQKDAVTQSDSATQGDSTMFDDLATQGDLLRCVVQRVHTVPDAVTAITASNGHIGLAAAWRGEPGRSEIIALVTCRGDVTKDRGGTDDPLGAVSCTAIDASVLHDAKFVKALASGASFVANDARNMLRSLLALGIDVRHLAFDSAIAAYLAEAETGTYDATAVARRWLRRRVAAPEGAPEGELNFDSSLDDTALHDAATQAAVAVMAEPVLRQALSESKVLSLYEDTELPLVRVLAKMEHLGIAVDRPCLQALEADLGGKSRALVATLHKLAGREFNVNSTKQLIQILFVERGLTGGKRTKTKKHSTDAATLEKIRDEWPEFIDALLLYRETEKLRATYAEGLLAEVAADGRIHASFNQTVARTGRLSSDRPNLHNIPVRTDAGRVFREAFVPTPGYEFLVADYNQIELRCIAHLAQDPGLLRAFNDGLDIHRATAAQVFGVDVGAVTSEQRSKAKMVSYGLAYGMEAYGLAQRLAIDVGEAKQILDAYFAAFPRVRKYMDDAVASARKLGFTTTLFGRRRQIEGFGTNRNVDAAAARMAMNAGIQGLAADIFKIALVAIDQRLEAEELASRLVLQVHDEVILEVLPAERERVGDLVLRAMEGAAKLDVPLVVNASWGSSWAAAKVA
ncbi:MAG: DNA polymerase I [Actinobacteria bacterium]|nr:DNA polymerase I [Actinomycetota bacterium]